MKKWLTLVLVLSLMVLSCQTQSSYRQVRSTTTVSDTGNTDTPAVTSEPVRPSTSTGSIKEQLSHYLQNPPSTRITYRLQTTVEDEEGKHTVSGVQEVALRGKDLKLHSQTEVEGQRFDTINYVVGGKYYACQMEKEWICYQFPEPEKDPTPQIQQSIKDDLEKLDVQDGGERSFLGKSAKCYKLLFKDPVHEEENGETIYCYDSEGAMLYSHTRVSNFESSLEATDYALASGEDFELVAEARPIEEAQE